MPDQASMASTAYMVNGFDPGTIDDLEPDMRQHVARRLQVLGPAYKLLYRHPVRFVRAEGVYLYDAAGNAYLDAYNNVPSVGHCHPHVVEAITRQAATLNVHTATGPICCWSTPSGWPRRSPTRSAMSCSPAPAARPSTWPCAWRGLPPGHRASS
jgi:hypothetical protein